MVAPATAGRENGHRRPRRRWVRSSHRAIRRRSSRRPRTPRSPKDTRRNGRSKRPTTGRWASSSAGSPSALRSWNDARSPSSASVTTPARPSSASAVRHVPERAMRDHGRHLPRVVRIALVVLLAVVDVAAYRAAVEVAFDTSDEWPAIIDSYLLGLLSLGMVVAAMFAAEQLKALHSARDHRLVDPETAVEDQLARRAGVAASRGAGAAVCGRAPRRRGRPARLRPDRCASLVLARHSCLLGLGTGRRLLRRVHLGEQAAR